MCVGVALAESELPLDLLGDERLRGRTHSRGGEREVRFLWRQRPRLMPVWHEGRLQLLRWGCRREEGRQLPCTGWTWLTTVEAGGWGPWGAEAVVIPATFALDNGVWFAVLQGVRGLLVRDEQGEPAVYLICEPATRYYRVMTRSERMPVLIGETI